MPVPDGRHIAPLYRHSLALLTDLYQLTMAYGYWKSGHADTEACFHLFFRKNPFQGGYAVACGLHSALELLQDLSFQPDDLAYLASLQGNDGQPLFERAFLDHLAQLRVQLDVAAVPEGTLVFPQEPLLRVSGPIIQAQILETALLTCVNFESLVATKAARICQAAQGEPVLEFGLRRAQGIDGGISASRAAYVGGCASTSNVLAGKLFGIPVKGTHAHSWIMLFGDEVEAFESYAEAMPNNCIFLVDTYDTLQGVRHAVDAGRRLRARGHELVGIRLDSGDLAYLSIEARRILDEGGFPDAAIVASNDLDERIICSLKKQGATIGVWGVGTKLATAYDQPALGGVYKLSAVRRPGQDWQPRIKLSEQRIKVSNPGLLQVRRFFEGGEAVADAIYEAGRSLEAGCTIVDPMDPTRQKRLSRQLEHRDLLVPIFEGGRLVYQAPSSAAVRQRVQRQLALFHGGVKRFTHPHAYPVGLERGLHVRKLDLIRRARGLQA